MTLNSLIVVLALCLLLPDTAFAYLDAGSGSMLLQILLAGAAGIIVAVRVFWRRIRLRLGIGKTDKGPAAE